MMDLRLYAVEEDGVRPLPVPDDATSFDDLYDGLALGVYSALRTFEHNKFLHLERHLARTYRSLEWVPWSYDLDEARLRRALHQVCTAYPYPEMRVRFDVLAEPARSLGTDSRELIGLMPFTPPPPQLYETGVRVNLAPDLRRRNPLAKTADFAQARRAYRIGGKIYEYLLLDDEGHILEGTGTNFFGVRDGVLRTAGTGVLEGITRHVILDLAAELNIPVRLEAVRLDEVAHLQEAALSGSSRALLPVVQIGEQVVGNGRPGPICRRLLSAYQAYVTQAVKTAVDD